jgi:dTDP-4-dehydrorhamnose reductase
MSLPAPPTAIVTGASGQIGRALRDSAPAEWRFAGYDRATLDVTRPRWVAEVLGRERPALVINAAAYTAVDDAEREVERTGRSTAPRGPPGRGVPSDRCAADSPLDRFRVRRRAGASYQPGDRPNPLGVYGRTKLAGEREVTRISGGAALVVRTAWIYASRGRNFVLTMLRHLRDRPSLGVVADQIGSPTWARSVAEALWAAAARPALRGVLHWTDAGVASWYDFAVAIQRGPGRGLLERSVPIRRSRPGYRRRAGPRSAC